MATESSPKLPPAPLMHLCFQRNNLQGKLPEAATPRFSDQDRVGEADGPTWAVVLLKPGDEVKDHPRLDGTKWRWTKHSAFWEHAEMYNPM